MTVRTKSRLLILLAMPLLPACSENPIPPVDEPEPTSPSPQEDLHFLSGSWTVQARRFLDDGTTQMLPGRSVITGSFDGHALKEVLSIAMPDGTVRETQSLIAERGNINYWVVARGDAGEGTFDVLGGAIGAGSGTFTSWDQSRPDGGRTRLRFTEAFADSFKVELTQSPDSGTTWNTSWQYTYTRGASAAPVGDVQNTCDTEEHHQFDFWLGDWQAMGASGQGGGTNDIRSRMGGCILEENWRGGASGTSFNMYDVRSELWYQVWTDTSGLLLLLKGVRDGDRMELTGTSGALHERITWFVLDDGRVRQRAESRVPQGVWSQSYDLIYTLR